MPRLGAHYRFVTLVAPLLGVESNVDSFLLGATAPDAAEPESEDGFSQHHFKGEDGQISLRNFLRRAEGIHRPLDDPTWSFVCGYYSHLWLDVFYTDHARPMRFKKDLGREDAETTRLVRTETEVLDAPFVLRFDGLFRQGPRDIFLPAYLEFVDLDRCVRLFRDVLDQSRAWAGLKPGFSMVDAEGYSAFLWKASGLFVGGILAS